MFAHQRHPFAPIPLNDNMASSPLRRQLVLPPVRRRLLIDNKNNGFNPNKLSKKTIKRKKNVGRWHPWERLAFLRGLRKYGRGQWKKISKLIPSRDTIQVKTHAQVMLKKFDDGQNIFEELDDLNRFQQSSSSTLEKSNGRPKGVNPRTIPTSYHEMIAAQSLLELSNRTPLRPQARRII